MKRNQTSIGQRVAAITLAVAMCFSISACKSQEEKDLEASKKALKESTEAAKQAQDKYNDLVDQVNEIEDLQNALGVGK